jgi:hypothetical protein
MRRIILQRAEPIISGDTAGAARQLAPLGTKLLNTALNSRANRRTNRTAYARKLTKEVLDRLEETSARLSAKSAPSTWPGTFAYLGDDIEDLEVELPGTVSYDFGSAAANGKRMSFEPFIEAYIKLR